jgi:uncharacterized membrane protein
MEVAGKRFSWAVVALVVVLVGAATAFALNLPGMGKCEKVKAVNGVVSIPLAKVSDGKSHFYRFTDNGKEIDFFVVKSAKGEIKTAFDACDVCYHEKKGYQQGGQDMICKNCNKKFAIDRIGPHETGGCNPSYLPHQQNGGNVVISVGDLKAGARFF